MLKHKQNESNELEDINTILHIRLYNPNQNRYNLDENILTLIREIDIKENELNKAKEKS